MSFSQVVEMLNLLYCFAQLIEFAAFVQLRIKHPDLPRPFKIPLGTLGVSLMLLVPTLFIFVMIGFSSVLSVVCAGCMCLLGFAVARLLTVADERGWCVFENQFIESCPSLINPFVDTKERREFLEMCLTSPVGTAAGGAGGAGWGAREGQPRAMSFLDGVYADSASLSAGTSLKDSNRGVSYGSVANSDRQANAADRVENTDSEMSALLHVDI
jgi:hypothetical protein